MQSSPRAVTPHFSTGPAATRRWLDISQEVEAGERQSPGLSLGTPACTHTRARFSASIHLYTSEFVCSHRRGSHLAWLTVTVACPPWHPQDATQPSARKAPDTGLQN